VLAGSTRFDGCEAHLMPEVLVFRHEQIAYFVSSPGDNEILLRRAGPSGTLDFVRYIVVILRINH
jgi:hypothetical protein